MVEGAQSVVNTYLDGAGVFAWRVNESGTGYEPVAAPARSRVSDLDDVLYRIASEIQKAAGKDGRAPEPVTSAAE